MLRVLNEELENVGATRGRGENVKSVARLVGPEAAVNNHSDAWITERVRATCKLPGNNTAAHVLGVDIGDADTRNAQFRDLAEKVARGRDKISTIGDSGTELVLTRRCADVCKVTHLLRAHGAKLESSTLERFDTELDKALALATGGTLHPQALKLAVRRTCCCQRS